MPTPLNPLIVARLRKYWIEPVVDLDGLLQELDGWISLLGPGPAIPTCDCCQTDLSFDWHLCASCSSGNIICNKCYECYDCEAGYASPGCCECGSSCGAYICHDCKILGDY